jgi:hypothetical protein
VEPRPDILVANEPALYRYVLASELTLLRPSFPVAQVDAADLDSTVSRIRPRLVICSQLTEIVRQNVTTSIVLYPDGTNQAILDVDGQQRVLPNPELTDLLVAVDTALDRG